MTEIVVFISARLDELEAFATEAREAMPRVQPSEADGWRRYFDSVLRDVEAKRQMLALHRPGFEAAHHGSTSPSRPGDGGLVCTDESWTVYGDGEYFEPWPCPTVRLLAAPYAGHPDFDPTWRLCDPMIITQTRGEPTVFNPAIRLIDPPREP